jgi:hypothetical protein
MMRWVVSFDDDAGRDSIRKEHSGQPALARG